MSNRRADHHRRIVDSAARRYWSHNCNNVRLRGDLLAELAAAPDANSALVRTFELIEATMAEQTDLLRLLQFSSLELRAKYVATLDERVATPLRMQIE